MPSARAGYRAAAAGGLLVLATACSNTVQVAAPTPDAGATALCRALHARLPDKVHGQKRRTTSPSSPLVSAWGKPAIALRCGVPRPPAMRADSELVTVNGISWFPKPGDRPITFTAVGRHAYVEVTVPLTYNPSGDVLIELTPAIKAAIPANSDATL